MVKQKRTILHRVPEESWKELEEGVVRGGMNMQSVQRVVPITQGGRKYNNNNLIIYVRTLIYYCMYKELIIAKVLILSRPFKIFNFIFVCKRTF